jgi:predicted RNase H-like HicB family nuclease
VGGYGVFFPDLPGCTSFGATLQEAALNAGEALQAHSDLAVEQGETIPEPSTLDRIAVDADVAEAARILVRADRPAARPASGLTNPATKKPRTRPGPRPCQTPGTKRFSS